MKVKYLFKEYLSAEKRFILKSSVSDETIEIINNLDFSDIDYSKSVNDYFVGFFSNPYLSAESNIFKIKSADGISIGYALPINSLVGLSPSTILEEDMYLKAYKYYACRNLLDEIEYDNEKYELSKNFVLSDFYNGDIIIIILCKPLMRDVGFEISPYYPCLANYGYYFYKNNQSYGFTQIANEERSSLKLLTDNFIKMEAGSQITLKKCSNPMFDNPIIKLIYEEFLPKADTSVYRFHILYQIIEYCIDKLFKSELDILIDNRSNFNPYELFDKMQELKKERKRVNDIVNRVSIDSKGLLETSLKEYIEALNPSYARSSLGDYVYDIRNIVFHDYKLVIEKHKVNELLLITLLVEKVIHNILLSLE